MSNQNETWFVRLNALSVRNLLAPVFGLSLYTAYVVLLFLRAGSNVEAGFALVFTAAAGWIGIASNKQVTVTPHELSVQTWWGVVRGKTATVRALGPDCRLTRQIDGTMRLLSPEPSIVPVSSRNQPALMAALRRAGIQVDDELGDWRKARPRLRWVRLGLIGGGLAATAVFILAALFAEASLASAIWPLAFAGLGAMGLGWILPTLLYREAAETAPSAREASPSHDASRPPA